MFIVSRKAETEFLTVAEFYYKKYCANTEQRLIMLEISDLHTYEGEE